MITQSINLNRVSRHNLVPWLSSTLLKLALLFVLPLSTSACNVSDTSRSEEMAASANAESNSTSDPYQIASNMEIATFGNGCFWCTEAVFQDIKGVIKVESGYSGGQVVNPTYKQVCAGTTGHAEVIQITYDPSLVTYAKLLEAFFYSHDPTTLNRQGNDVGTQYRSAIFYHSEAQKQAAEAIIIELDKSGAWPDKIVTEVTPFKTFYKAEDYHQNYYNENGMQPYCQFVIKPKVEKFRKVFAAYLKDGKSK